MDLKASFWQKKHDQTKKTKVSCTEKEGRKIFETDDDNHGLTRFKIFKFFDSSKMSFLWTKKRPFE